MYRGYLNKKGGEMAESAVSLVIENLVPLLVQKVKLLKGIHDEVESIRGELEFIQSFLKDADARAEREDMNNVAKTWVKLVREQAYHIEDVIDKYILCFAKNLMSEGHTSISSRMFFTLL